MKSKICILFSMSLMLLSVSTLASNDLQEKAEKAYAEKNYKTFISIYENILKEGNTSYKLYYNLGNAYYIFL